MSNNIKTLSALSLILLTVGSVGNVRNLPAIALLGESLPFLFSFAIIFFLVPITLLAAELSTTWPGKGGIYSWSKYVFGKKIGFLTIWFQWIGNIIWFPGILSFAAASIGYLISPEFANNKLFIMSVIIVIFWGTTIVNFYGMKFSAHLNNFCTLAGLFLPIALIIGIGIAWFFSDNAIQLHFTKQNFFPDFHNSEMLIALSGMIMSFCGIEIATIHSDEVKNPHRSFPIALSMATLILALFLICGAFSIAIILPPHQMNILAGIMQTFQIFLSTYNLIWAMPAIAILLVLGCIGSVNNWIIAPIKGLSIAASETKHLKHFAKSNQHNAPHVLLIYQAIIVTLLMFVFIALPSVNASYWLLTNLALQLFMLMYILLFAAGIRARFKHPTIQRSFTIPGKNIGMMIIGTLGIIGALLTFAIGFVPPSDIQNGGIFRYEIILLLCLAFTILPPFFIHKKAKEEPENEILKVIETS